jgi:hypothetical protein
MFVNLHPYLVSLLSLKERTCNANEVTKLSFRVSLITFESVNRFLRNLVRKSGHWRLSRRHTNFPTWQTFKLLRWMQNFHQPTWDHGILYADRSSEDEHFVRQFLWKNVRRERLNLKINILFNEDNSWTVALKHLKFGTEKIKVLFEWLFCLTKIFNITGGAKFLTSVGTSTKHYVEFCNMFVNYLTSC